MRTPSAYLARRTATDSTMTPLIDVVFLLLIFFVWTASFQIAEQVLPGRVSEQSGQDGSSVETPPPEADFSDVVVRIFYRGNAPSWEVNAQPVSDLTALRSRLTVIQQVNATAPVIVHPDPATPLQHVIEAYDTTRLVGFEQVQFAVNTSAPLSE